MKILIKMAPAFAALIIFTAAESGFDSGDYLRENVVERKLPNGITVLMIDRGFSPTLSLNIFFRVGSVEEDYNTTGAVHMLEHMLFKGTEKYGTTDYAAEKRLLNEIRSVGETIDYIKLSNPDNESIPGLEKRLRELQKKHAEYVVHSPYDAVYTGIGGVGFNASTSKDATGYYIRLPASELEKWAEMESDRFLNPVMREYYLERENVIEERMMVVESRGTGGLYERFIAAAFIAHPYRHPILGWGSVIPFLSLKDVHDFYRKYYIPSRMVITVAGRHDPEKTYNVIKKYFSEIPPGPEPRGISVREPAQRGERRIQYEFDANPYLILGWHKPTFPHRDDYVFDVISEMLTGGSASILREDLIRDRGIALSVSSANGIPGVRYDNMFVVMGAPREPHRVDELEAAILERIEELKTEVDPDHLQSAVNRIETGVIFSLSTNAGLTRMLGRWQTVYGDWRYAADYVENIRSVTPEEIKKAAAAYLNRNNMTSASMIRPGKGEDEK